MARHRPAFLLFCLETPLIMSPTMPCAMVAVSVWVRMKSSGMIFSRLLLRRPSRLTESVNSFEKSRPRRCPANPMPDFLKLMRLCLPNSVPKSSAAFCASRRSPRLS